MTCIATPSLQQREGSMSGGDTGTAMAINASSIDLLDGAGSLDQEVSILSF